jgi:hypothetical protein
MGVSFRDLYLTYLGSPIDGSNRSAPVVGIRSNRIPASGRYPAGLMFVFGAKAGLSTRVVLPQVSNYEKKPPMTRAVTPHLQHTRCFEKP